MLVSEILTRAYTVWPIGTVRYSMETTNSPTGHRDDCSGFASAVYALPPPGEDTVSLVSKGFLTQIPNSEVAPGDAVGLLGPGTEGANGHVAIVTGVHDGIIDTIEQRGGVKGPSYASYANGLPSGWQTYRFAEITVKKRGMMYAWIAQDDTGIAIVWISGDKVVCWSNVGNVEAVAGWNAAGVPGPFVVPSIAQLGTPAGE